LILQFDINVCCKIMYKLFNLFYLNAFFNFTDMLCAQYNYLVKAKNQWIFLIDVSSLKGLMFDDKRNLMHNLILRFDINVCCKIMYKLFNLFYLNAFFNFTDMLFTQNNYLVKRRNR